MINNLVHLRASQMLGKDIDEYINEPDEINVLEKMIDDLVYKRVAQVLQNDIDDCDAKRN